MSIRNFRAGVSYLLSLSLILITPAPLMAERPKNASEKGFRPDWNLQAQQEYDPALKEFAEAPWRSPEPLNISAQDPVLDEDPYFLGSESYVSPFNANGGSSTAFRTDSRAIEIQLPNARQALRIEQPLKPLFEFENFLFLQASDSKLFAAKSDRDENYGEGLFFIDKNYIQTELHKNGTPNPVPVFFIPLEGQGWSGQVHRLAVGPLTTFALRTDSGASETLDLIQIRDLAKILHSQVVLATVVALKHNPEALAKMRRAFLSNNGQQVELPFTRLPRGATAAFGFFYTGLNLDHPADGLFQIKNSASWDLSILPKAYASDLLTPDVLERLATVSWITLSTLGLGWLAQHTLLKQRMLERRAYVEAKEDEVARLEGREPKPRDGVWYKTKREIKETVDVFSHGLSALASTPGVATGFLFEYGADKFLGKVGRNGFVRWFLEKTFLYGRKQNEWIMVSANTFVLGVMVLGGIDTLSVVLQLLLVSPVFFPWVGGLISPEMEKHAAEQFSGNNAATNNVITSEIMRNITGYVVHGAYSYSSSQRNALLEIVRPEVERQMRNEHKEPSGAEFDRRIEARLELMLVERGLPSKKEFLFSGPSLLRGLAALMGYKVDRDRLYKSPDYKRSGGANLTEDEKAVLHDKKELAKRISDRLDRLYESASQYPENQAEVERFKKAGETLKKSMLMNVEKEMDQESFVLEKARWGLLSHVLKRARLQAEDLSSIYPQNEKLKATVALLAQTEKQYHVVIESIKRPWKVVANVKDAIKVRKMMTVLSYEGDVVNETVKYLDLWDETARNPEAAQLAGQLYRQSLFSLIQNRPDYVRPTEADLIKYLPEARAEADQVIQAAGEAKSFDETDREILALENVKKKAQEARSKAKAESWQPAKVGPMEAYQRGHAHREAMVQVVQKMGVEVMENPAMQMALAAGNSDWVVDIANGSSPAADKTLTPLTFTGDADQLLVESEEARGLYRDEYRKALANIVGLEAMPAEKSALVRKAMAAADKEVDVNLNNNPGWKEYLSKLDEFQRIRFLTHQYADTFLSKYVEMTVSNSSEVSLTSVEQPGFFQKIRMVIHRSLEKKATTVMESEAGNSGLDQLRLQVAKFNSLKKVLFESGRNFENDPAIEAALASGKVEQVLAVKDRLKQLVEAEVAELSVDANLKARYETTLKEELMEQPSLLQAANTAVRASESPMDNTAYRPGLGHWLRRNIPWYQDAKTDVQLTTRIMWTSLTIGYWTQFYIWQVKFPWPTAVLFLLTGGLTTIIHYWTDRIMMNVGIRPMNDLWSKVKYSILYTWLTYPSYLPFFFLNEDFNKMWSRWITMPLSEYLVSPISSACEKLLSAIF